MPEYSEAHPEYNVDESVKDVDDGAIKQEQVPAKEVPAAGDFSAAAASIISQEYVSASLFFAVVLFIAVILIRRCRRSSESKIDEKSVA